MKNKINLIAIESKTPYGTKYVATIKVADLLGDVFDNNKIQRAINLKSIKELKTDLLRSYKSDKVPFMASMIGNITLNEIKRNDISLANECHYYNAIDKTLSIPNIKGSIAIVDGGHRTTAFRILYMELLDKIDTIKNVSAKLIYKSVLRDLLETELTIDLYENLSDENSAKLFLDVNKGHAISAGRRYYYEDTRFDGIVQYFSNNNNKYNIDLDIDTRAIQDKNKVPYAYIYKLIKDTYDILIKTRTTNPIGILITLIENIFNSIEYKNITKSYFEDIKKLIKFYVEVNAEFDLKDIIAIITSKSFIDGTKGYKYYKKNEKSILKYSSENLSHLYTR